MKKIIVILASLFITTSALFSQSNKTPVINNQQKNQIHKIHQGVKTGELTHHETKRLVKQEAKLQKHKKIAKSDGVVTKREKVRLHKETHKLNKQIYKQKHDRQKRR